MQVAERDNFEDNRADIMLSLLQFHSVKVDGTFYIDYYAFVAAINVSRHINALSRRRLRYPQHFVELQGMPFISEQYARAIINYKAALQKVEALKPIA